SCPTRRSSDLGEIRRRVGVAQFHRRAARIAGLRVLQQARVDHAAAIELQRQHVVAQPRDRRGGDRRGGLRGLPAAGGGGRDRGARRRRGDGMGRGGNRGRRLLGGGAFLAPLH